MADPSESLPALVEAAAEEAHRCRSPQIGTEHLLLAAAAVSTGRLGAAFTEFGLTHESLARRLERLLAPSAPGTPTHVVERDASRLIQLSPGAAAAVAGAQGAERPVERVIAAIIAQESSYMAAGLLKATLAEGPRGAAPADRARQFEDVVLSLLEDGEDGGDLTTSPCA